MDENKTLTPEEIAEGVKQSKTEKAVKFTPEEEEYAKKVFEELKLPIQLKDKDLEFGAGELDIRKLSTKNIMQLFFRTQVANNLYLNDISRAILDLTRLFMAFLYKYGVDDITKEIAATLEKLQEEAGKFTK